MPTDQAGLYARTLAALNLEAEQRLAFLQARHADVDRLERFALLLGSRGWSATPQVRVSPDGVELAVWVNVTSRHQRSELLGDIQHFDVEIQRVSDLDIGDVLFYLLRCNGGFVLQLRVGQCYRPEPLVLREAA